MYYSEISELFSDKLLIKFELLGVTKVIRCTEIERSRINGIIFKEILINAVEYLFRERKTQLYYRTAKRNSGILITIAEIQNIIDLWKDYRTKDIQLLVNKYLNRIMPKFDKIFDLDIIEEKHKNLYSKYLSIKDLHTNFNDVLKFFKISTNTTV